MEKGNKKLPDFKQLHDRVIAEPSNGPFFAIKTNLDDPDDKENPYASERASEEESEKLKRFFNDDIL